MANNDIDSRYAWVRLAVSFALLTIGGCCMYIAVVAMPVIEAEFVTTRSQASLPYSMIMLGWAFGTIWMGRLYDRFGIQLPLMIGVAGLSGGLVLAGFAPNLAIFAGVHGVLIGMLGASSLFAPLLADVSHWFDRRRGIAIAIVASGQYVAGAIWPPVANAMIANQGWRETFITIGIFCLFTMMPLTFALRRRLNAHLDQAANVASVDKPPFDLGLPPNAIQTLLCVAGLGCCIAMAMPQVHLVSMCAGLGIGPARGSEMLALMLGCGVVSRLSFGLLMDKLGGLRTLLVASSLQCLALFFFLPAKGVVSLYVVSALFGLFQGGLVPCYAIIVREYFPPSQAGSRMGLLIMATLVGMAAGGWLSGVIYDETHSYTLAFLHGIAWNFINIGIVVFLLWRRQLVTKFSAAPAT